MSATDIDFEDLAAAMREWRARPAPAPIPPDPGMSPDMAALLGCDTPEGRVGYARLNGWREAGYRGPLDERGQIPDPDNPANAWKLRNLARLGGDR
ncbi:hypothetical protein [Nocardia sp. NPDC051750]|uniref:hypothetical protein n=1 Tax=Nocardia sp. NPDC051750 TaxID=3364325 RepID=UPI00379B779F